MKFSILIIAFYAFCIIPRPTYGIDPQPDTPPVDSPPIEIFIEIIADKT